MVKISRYSLAVSCLLALLGGLLIADCALAQRRGDRGDRDDRDDRRDRDDDDRRGSREDRIQGYVRAWDADGDGYITRDQVSGRSQRYLDELAKRAGVSTTGRIKVEDLIKGRSSSQEQEQSEKALAFGEANDEQKAAGFDDPLASDAGTSGFIPATPEEREGARNTADSLIKKYDENGNGILERDEWIKISGNPANADINRDGKISRTELINRLIVMRRSREGAGDKNSGDKKTDSRARDGKRPDAADKRDGSRLSYRFTTAIDRIPEKAREWIAKYDKDGDGQVSMHEYSQSWSESRVREFGGYDANSDGVITGEEYLAKK